MANHVCPWWIGYLLISPLRKWMQPPGRILQPYIKEGMTVLDLGSGMGFFTLDMARLVGPPGRVIAVDIQQRMLDSLSRRAHRKGLAQRIELVLSRPERLGLAEPVDFCLAYAVMHEAPTPALLFDEIREILKPDGLILLCEPTSHVSEGRFAAIVQSAEEAGLHISGRPTIGRSRSVELRPRDDR